MAGCHKTTAARALADSPLLPEHTKARIRALATHIGYRRDPLFAALAARRNRPRGARGLRSLIAIVHDFETADGWRQYHTGKLYYEGMIERADALGFGLVEIAAGSENRSSGHVDRMLRARGCTCVVIPTQRRLQSRLRLKWQNYSVVTLGFAFSGPEFHRVAHHHARNAILALETVRARGFRRIGLAIRPEFDRRIQYGITEGFLLWREQQTTGGPHPIYRPQHEANYEEFAEWLRKKRPEAVLAGAIPVNWAERAGRNVPDDLGYVFPDCPSENSPYAGIDTCSRLVGAAAIDQVAAMHLHSERGVPAHSRLTLVPGRWMEGPTLKSKTVGR